MQHVHTYVLRGDSPLHFTVNMAVLQPLLQAGADVNLKNKEVCCRHAAADMHELSHDWLHNCLFVWLEYTGVIGLCEPTVPVCADTAHQPASPFDFD